jgi:hypothetical protein
MSYAAAPKGHKGRALNKYGYKTETAGTVKVGIKGKCWCYLSDLACRCSQFLSQSSTELHAAEQALLMLPHCLWPDSCLSPRTGARAQHRAGRLLRRHLTAQGSSQQVARQHQAAQGAEPGCGAGASTCTPQGETGSPCMPAVCLCPRAAGCAASR